MDVQEVEDEVVITMSSEEFSELKERFSGAWNFIRRAVKESGRVYGKAVAGDFEAEVIRGRIGKLEQSRANLYSQLETLAREHGLRLQQLEDPMKRSFDPEKVRAIDGRVNELMTLLHEVIDRVKRLETQTEFETSEDSNRISDLARRLNELKDRTQVEIESILAGHGGRLQQIEDRIDAFGVTPVVSRPSPVEFLERARGVEKQALDAAEDRVRRYMTGHWSTASVEGVIRSLRRTQMAPGGVVGYDDNLQLQEFSARPIKDHSFQYSSPDRRHCSYRGNPEDKKCGLLQSEHEYAPLPQSEFPVRPIKDNPQA